MARLTLTVSERQAGRTAGSLLKHELGLSTTCVNRLKWSETGLLLDGRRVFTNAVVRAGQVLEADLGKAERPSRSRPSPWTSISCSRTSTCWCWTSRRLWR